MSSTNGHKKDIWYLTEPIDGYDARYIKDEEFGNTYTVCMRPVDGKWLGWVAEEQHVKHTADTKDKLVEEITKILFDTLDAEGAAFDKQIEEDAKSGRLMDAIKAGKFSMEK